MHDFGLLSYINTGVTQSQQKDKNMHISLGSISHRHLEISFAQEARTKTEIGQQGEGTGHWSRVTTL